MTPKPNTEVTIPSWLIVAAVLGMGPADTLASKLVTGPEYSELRLAIDQLSDQVRELSAELELVKRGCR